MKLLFSNPPWFTEAEVNGCRQLRRGIRAGSRWPFTRPAEFLPDHHQYGGYLPVPFFMTSAAAYAQRAFPNDYVWVRDSIARGESYDAFFEYIETEAPDWVVVETATPSYKHDLGVIREIKLLLPHVRIILTGTIVADRDFKLPAEVFAAVRGEYEKGVITAIQGTGGLVDFNLLTREEMNALPFPLYDPATEGIYRDVCPVMPPELGEQWPHMQIWTSRGCPFRCCFCGWPATMTGNDPDGTQARSVRGHNAEWVAAMIEDRQREAAKHDWAYRSTFIDDDTFNLTDKHALAMSEVLAKTGLPWSAMCRADTLKPDTWRVMREAGCFGVKVGVESGSQTVIDTIVNKRLNLHDVEHKWLPLLKELGFVVHTTWTEGLPGETADQRAETHAMIARLYRKHLHRTHQLSGTAEITGTPLHTLRVKGDLQKYPGAHVGEGYTVSLDGQRKVEEMHK